MGVRGLLISVVTTFVLSFPSLGVQADHLKFEAQQYYEYTILRDGDPIGVYRITYNPQSDHEVDIEAEIDVAVVLGPITLYEYKHRRQESWRDGALIESVAETDKNGDHYDIKITRDADNGYTRVINGRVDKFDKSVKVMAMWHSDLFNTKNFISPIEDKTYTVTVDYVGDDKIELFDQMIDAKYYKMTGSVERELWYDEDGHVMKVRLHDFMSEIEYVLTPNGKKVTFADETVPIEPAGAPNLAGIGASKK